MTLIRDLTISLNKDYVFYYGWFCFMQEPLTDMQALEEDLTKFRHCIENIGTQLDDELNRQDMRKLRASIRQKATRMENDLKDRQKTK